MSTWDDRSSEIGGPSLFQRHRVALPFALGFISGLTGGGLLVGGVFLGYPVGRSGAGSSGAGIGVVGSIIGSAILIAWAVWSMVDGGCPSCIDAVIVAWIVPFMYVVPFVIGCALGSWRYRRATRRTRTA